jgi:3-oxoacyl-[acyl-carrier protein] reductase
VKEDKARPVVLVTGAAQGIGLGVAKELASRGWRTHGVYRSSAGLAELEERFPSRVHGADLTCQADCRRVVAEVLERDGRLDGVVHAVGEYLAGPLEGLGADDFADLFTSNATSAFVLVEAARQAVREARGSYVFFGCAGIESLRARRDAAAYVAAKSALLVFMRSLALEEAPYGVRANMVSPGLVPHEHASEDTHGLAAKVPSGRAGTAGDLAQAAAWMLSAEAEHVTGQNLDVAGGWLL